MNNKCQQWPRNPRLGAGFHRVSSVARVAWAALALALGSGPAAAGGNRPADPPRLSGQVTGTGLLAASNGKGVGGGTSNGNGTGAPGEAALPGAGAAMQDPAQLQGAVAVQDAVAVQGTVPAAVPEVRLAAASGNGHWHIVPRTLEAGIVINVPQRMLFLFEGGALRGAWRVTAGKPDWPTPTGAFTVVNRQKDKTWMVPPSIQAEMRRERKRVLTEVPPGPDNPLGRHWIGLSMPGIGIHGTNAPSSIYGLRSHGCVRMHPRDVSQLFDRVAAGTPGEMIYTPALLARTPDGRVYAEVHADAYRKGVNPVRVLRALAVDNGLDALIDWKRVEAVAKARQGRAVEVGLPGTGSQKKTRVRLASR